MRGTGSDKDYPENGLAKRSEASINLSTATDRRSDRVYFTQPLGGSHFINRNRAEREKLKEGKKDKLLRSVVKKTSQKAFRHCF